MSSNHSAGCEHHSSHSHKSEIRTYILVFLVTLLICAIQLAGSWLSGSLALFADTVHAALDGLGAGISVFVAYVARTHHDPVSLRVLWMRISGVILLGALVWVIYEAIERLYEPHTVAGLSVMGIAFVGAVLNAVQHRLLHHEHSVTAKAQRLHVLGDLLSSIAVICGGFMMWTTGWVLVDPLLSIGIALFVGYSTVKMIIAGTSQEHH